jgi:hypothetical protein
MLKLLFAHVVAFFLLFVYGVPAASHVLHSQSFGFRGGVIAALLLALSVEVVMFIGAILGKLAVDGLKINPLVQRGKAELVATAAISLLILPFLLLASKISSAGLELSFLSALAITISIVAILDVMVRVKRFYITNYVR